MAGTVVFSPGPCAWPPSGATAGALPTATSAAPALAPDDPPVQPASARPHTISTTIPDDARVLGLMIPIPSASCGKDGSPRAPRCPGTDNEPVSAVAKDYRVMRSCPASVVHVAGR